MQIAAAVRDLLAMLLSMAQHGPALADAARHAIAPEDSRPSSTGAPTLPAQIGAWLVDRVLLDRAGWDVDFSEAQCAPKSCCAALQESTWMSFDAIMLAVTSLQI